MQTHAFTHGVDLPIDRDTAFAFLLDPEQVPTYDPDFRSWVPQEHPPRVGTLVDFEARYGRVWASGTSRFEVFDPPRRVELALVRPRTPIRSRLIWELDPTERGCRFTYRFETTAPAGLGWAGRRLLTTATAGMADKLDALPGRMAPA